MEHAQHFDLIIVGSGSGNSMANRENHHLNIAIVDGGLFGGTCINVGCIPTKMYVYPADLVRSAQHAHQVGVDASVNAVDWAAIRERVFDQRIDPIRADALEYRRGERTPNVTLFEQNATFIGPKTLQVGNQVITGDTIVLATGSHTFIPEVIAQAVEASAGSDSPFAYETNATIMRLPEAPSSVIILGGGIIAAEFAHVLSAAGSKVTIVNRSETLLRASDETVAQRFTAEASKEWDLRLGRTVTHAQRSTEAGQPEVQLTLDNGDVVTAQTLLVASGRVPNTQELNCAAAGVELHTDGRVKTDEFGRTTADGIWALGDVSNTFQLKHVANHEQRIVSHNIAHPEDLLAINHHAVPSAVFTHPQIASVGMTEAQAREAGLPITVKIQEYADVAYGWAMEDRTGFCKVIANADTGKLLGAHIMGYQASLLLQPLVTALAFDIDMREFARNQYWPHPALSEVVENAVLGLQFSSTASQPKNRVLP